MFRFLIIILSLLFNTAYSQVVINEIMSSNNNCITDEDGDNSDWIELYNFGNEEIDLTGYYLSDKDENILMWELPEISIKPKDFLLIFASGKDRSISGKELHTNFKIDKQGEPVILSDNSGNFIDRLPPAYIETDYSFGRFPDGDINLFLFANPSPGSSNHGLTAPPKYAELYFSHEPGYYDNNFLLNIIASDNIEIRYTTDGSIPTDSSMIYNKAIKIDSRSEEENVYSEIPSAVGFYWQAPKGNIKKIHIIRARPYINGIPVGKELWGSFWTGHHNPKKNDLPVISVICEPDDLFDYEKGIYIPGLFYDIGKEGNYIQKGREAERDAIFSFFDKDGNLEVNQKIGIRIHGQSSREFRQKTLRLYARNSYGEEYFNYPFFPDRDNDKFKRLLLNTTMGDRSSETLFKDEMCTYLIRNLDMDYIAYIPVLVFLNGEYWGIHFLKEKRDKYYLENNHNVDSDNLDILHGYSGIIQGTNTHYLQMLDYITFNDPLEPKTYEEIKKRMDIDNYIDYICAQLYLNNRDWPHNNVEFWRPDTVGGKWRWIFWDLDLSTKHYYEDNISIYMAEEVEPQFFLLHSLLKIPGFKNDFLSRFYYHVENTFNPNKINEAINYFKKMLIPYIHEHVYRWQYPLTVYEWEENITVLESFAIMRPAEIMSILQKNLLSPFNIYPNPADKILIIHNKKNTYADLEDLSISIYNIKGQKINVASKINNNNEIEINLEGMNSGIYIVKILNNNMVFTHKFVKTN